MRSKILLVALAGVLLFAGSLAADPTPPSDLGTLINTMNGQAVSTYWTADVWSWVFKDGSMYNFAWQFENTATSAQIAALFAVDAPCEGFTTATCPFMDDTYIDSVTVGTSFGGLYTVIQGQEWSVDEPTGPSTAAGDQQPVTAFATQGGGTIRYDFTGTAPTGKVKPGQWSDIFWAKTNAGDYRSNGDFAAKDGSSADTPTFRPTGPVVPEPTGLLLMGTGLIGFAGFLRRKLFA